jgi:hypothetical protein
MFIMESCRVVPINNYPLHIATPHSTLIAFLPMKTMSDEVLSMGHFHLNIQQEIRWWSMKTWWPILCCYSASSFNYIFCKNYPLLEMLSRDIFSWIFFWESRCLSPSVHISLLCYHSTFNCNYLNLMNKIIFWKIGTCILYALQLQTQLSE